jgi:hypothetical protein
MYCILLINHHKVWFVCTTAYTLFALFWVLNFRPDFSKKFRKSHPILTGSGFGFVWNWILLPIIHKVVFLFTPKLYRAVVSKELKKDIEAENKVIIKDLQYQIKMLEDESREVYNKSVINTNAKDTAYWDGVKYGYALKSKQEDKPQTQIKTLQEIALGNKTVNGLVVAYLEERGYCKLVWDDEKNNKYHYVCTEKGNKRLARKEKKRT